MGEIKWDIVSSWKHVESLARLGYSESSPHHPYTNLTAFPKRSGREYAR
jgi:hypothetical protein